MPLLLRAVKADLESEESHLGDSFDLLDTSILGVQIPALTHIHLKMGKPTADGDKIVGTSCHGSPT